MFLAKIGLVAFAVQSVLAGPAVETLPAPVRHRFSFEALANSRYSTHSGFTDSLDRSVLATVLWAMNRVPRLGTYRDFYVATPENVYRFDPSANALIPHLAGDRRYNSGSAFEIGVAVERHEEAGMVTQVGLLAGTAFQDCPDQPVASCPMKWATDHANEQWKPARPLKMVTVFGRTEPSPIDTNCCAVSSDSTLPAPYVSGLDTFENVLETLCQDSTFDPAGLSFETISQLLWAAYGVTPHMTYNGRQGTTVPTALAAYHLTGRIYLVHSSGVDRYHNRRPPGTDLRTADHRLARIFSGDLRPGLRQALPRLPSSAPVYFVVCASDTAAYGPLQEAGCAAIQLLLQARALGLAGFLTIPLNRNERSAVITALGLPSAHFPILVFSCGEPAASGVVEDDRPGLVRIVRAGPAVRRGRMRMEYWLGQSGDVRVEVFDMLGRPIRVLLEERQSVGYHSVTWDGTGPHGERLKRGTYLIVVFARGAMAKHKVTLG
ncbi:MAG: nitroreductase family protein [candidate division WOR-3 bacterium]